MTTTLPSADQVRRVLAITPEYIGPWLVLQYAGSTAHGTYLPSSDPSHIDDVDMLGVWLPTRQNLLGLTNTEHWMQWDNELDIVTYEIRKFAKLLMKGNPNVLTMLWSEMQPLYTTVLWNLWRENRRIFLSERVYESFTGYAYGQLSRLSHPNTRGYMGRERKQLFEKHGYDLKNAAHCLRLLHMGLELMEDGDLHIDRTGRDLDMLLAVKTGQWTLGQVEREAEAGFAKMEALRPERPLPAKPDIEAVEALVMHTLETGLRL